MICHPFFGKQVRKSIVAKARKPIDFSKSRCYTGRMAQTTRLDPYVEALLARQRELALSSQDFARRLGVDPSTWCLVRSGRRGIGGKLITGGRSAFPDIPFPFVADLREIKYSGCSDVQEQERVRA